MRYIPILPDVKIIDIFGNPVLAEVDEKGKKYESGEERPQSVLSHKNFLLSRLADPKMTITLDTITQLLRMRETFHSLKSNQRYVAIEEEDWKLLCTSVQAPTGGYLHQFGHNFYDFGRAVLDASSKEPGQRKVVEK